MQRKEEGRVWRTGAAAAMSAFVVLGLAACGGDDAPAATAGSNSGGQSPAGITVDGTSKTVAADQNNEVAVMAPPMPDNKYGEVSQTGLSMAKLAASALSEAAPGAYTGFKSDKGFELTRGVVTDLAGNGQYAIGRWTDGTDTSGAVYNKNQGRMWAVGTPLNIELTADRPLNCHLEAATSPVALNGNTAPGKLETATASARVAQAKGDSILNTDIDLNLGYSIGQDAKRSFEIHTTSIGAQGYMTSRSGGYTIVTRMVGKDENAPYWLLSYTFDAPTTGTISGVAALACTRSAVQTPDQSAQSDQSDASADPQRPPSGRGVPIPASS
ncbi:hypothetical protein [Burkholderia glumae]|uniref:Lipoprotein transmembrane n=2 Tax=Burkholderia glumae TaxID=337 RepID=A0ABY5B9T1_BURGL|nr:hypothetical protein [Burkholderia glumae]AJY62707.1 putative lipoprotein transmembrane [Burkholderia glumae LMG 2196 = ATCC 33617]MCM2483707.1 hypothetical protein [Burkholderia glumae]MCM2509401.1 hypothetical protein [Burkholderia glumae]MCM2541478.1 hypothetical protein [Burkholderia glumae]MCM2545003.1 hypothetical protein [Burkholderia glumae]